MTSSSIASSKSERWNSSSRASLRRPKSSSELRKAMTLSHSGITSSDAGYEVRLHRKVEDYLDDLKEISEEQWKRCWKALIELERDPFIPRSGVDIRRWRGKGFEYRLRMGRHRLGYNVDKKSRVVSVIAVWFK